MQILSVIVGIIEAIPVFDKWFGLLLEVFIRAKLTKITGPPIEREHKKAVVYKKIQEAKSHNEKRILFSLLNDIDRGM